MKVDTVEVQAQGGTIIHAQIASEVTTANSGPDGKRVSKTSDPSVYRAPKDHALIKDETRVDIISQRGSEHRYQIDYSDYVEVIPGTGIKLPTTVTVTTHARSSKGPFGGSGGMKVLVHVTMTKYRNLA